MVDIIGTIIHLVVAGIIAGIFVWLAAKALKAPRATYWHGILTVVSAIILPPIQNQKQNETSIDLALTGISAQS